ncbi:MAG TPA: NTP transferase domain-containing protein [Gammaproteobacteria bacterium]|nr:NTP transferase domain-containing protein [Gammaproteobacteria bacterium]HET7588219.1 NTP transferase domain-containing protein [Gammaproteobacteria bacterium]
MQALALNSLVEDEDPSIGLVILATDARVRLRRNRRRARYRGKTLLWQTVDAALASSCRPVVVVLGARDAILRDEIATTNEPGRLKVVVNWAWQEGISSSIRQGVTALDASPRRVDAAIFVRTRLAPAAGVIEGLVAAYQAGRGPVVASPNQRTGYGLPTLVHRKLFPELLRLHGAQGLEHVIQRHHPRPGTFSAQHSKARYRIARDYIGGKHEGSTHTSLRRPRSHGDRGSASPATAGR